MTTEQATTSQLLNDTVEHMTAAMEGRMFYTKTVQQHYDAEEAITMATDIQALTLAYEQALQSLTNSADDLYEPGWEHADFTAMPNEEPYDYAVDPDLGVQVGFSVSEQGDGIRYQWWFRILARRKATAE